MSLNGACSLFDPTGKRKPPVCLCSKERSNSCKRAAVHADTASTTTAEAQSGSQAYPANAVKNLCSGQASDHYDLPDGSLTAVGRT